MVKKVSKRKQAKKKAPQTGVGDVIWENVKSLLIAVVLAVIIKTSIVEAYKIPSASMEDTLLVGDFLAANKFIYGAQIPLLGFRLPAIRDPRQGDVIIFKWPRDRQTNYIKRCIALPGQTVEVRNKIVYVDGVRFPDPEYSKYDTLNIHPRPAENMDSRDNWGPHRVPANHYFMMGDNRDNSSDSRMWGPVHRDLIQGEAMIIHWSWEPDMDSPDAKISEPLSVPRMFVYNIIHFFERVRWSRLANLIE